MALTTDWIEPNEIVWRIEIRCVIETNDCDFQVL